jgi:hypothetical protein
MVSFYTELTRVRLGDLDDLTWRSWRYLEEGQYLTAIRLADLLSSRRDGEPVTLAYQRFVKMVSLCLYKQCADGRAELRRVGIPGAAGEWQQSVFRYLTGDLTEDTLVNTAPRREEQTEAVPKPTFSPRRLRWQSRTSPQGWLLHSS